MPVIAAGLIRTPDQAEQALATGLSLVAVGQGLVINPDWVELARNGKARQIATALDLPRPPRLAIPGEAEQGDRRHDRLVRLKGRGNILVTVS